ncbi:MAG: hypothetical protein ACRDPX_01590 [Gaiellaceae bacterium]
MPRCWPAAYWLSWTENPRSIGPSAGHAHAQAVSGLKASDQTAIAPTQIARVVARRVNMERR